MAGRISLAFVLATVVLATSRTPEAIRPLYGSDCGCLRIPVHHLRGAAVRHEPQSGTVVRQRVCGAELDVAVGLFLPRQPE